MATFPPKFLWGASTSSHQVEGHNHNSWSEWEKAKASRLAKQAARRYSRLPNWQEIKSQAQDPGNYISGAACDHYHRFPEDFQIAKSLGLSAYRFSLEWSRIEPEENQFSQKELQHYQEVIKTLKQHHIEPFVTLWHWTLPLWLTHKGGWKNKNTPRYFVRYAEKVATTLGTDVRFWLTINEPEIYASASYLNGRWPPQEKSFFAYVAVLRHLQKGHKLAYQAIKKTHPRAQVGIAKNNAYFEADRNLLINQIIKKAADWWWNFYPLNQMKNYQDFIGLNHYFHNRINKGFNKNENKIVSDMGWELYPEAIYYVLKDLKKYQKPIYITENGLADAQDEKRAWFIRETLKNVAKAIAEDVDVKGYFHWSLLDNFEWAEGFWPRYGLISIDYRSLERKVRPSALQFAKIIKDNQID